MERSPAQHRPFLAMLLVGAFACGQSAAPEVSHRRPTVGQSVTFASADDARIAVFKVLDGRLVKIYEQSADGVIAFAMSDASSLWLAREAEPKDPRRGHIVTRVTEGNVQQSVVVPWRPPQLDPPAQQPLWRPTLVVAVGGKVGAPRSARPWVIGSVLAGRSRHRVLDQQIDRMSVDQHSGPLRAGPTYDRV
jgi:hypothetical protein